MPAQQSPCAGIVTFLLSPNNPRHVLGMDAMTMEPLHIDTSLAMESKPEFEDSFMGSQRMSCPSSTTSSFSASSSVYDPFTPTSGRSTPGHQSIDLESSINMNLNMEITPPPNSLCNYFGADSHKSAIPQMSAVYGDAMMADNFPVTPVRKPAMGMSGTLGLDYNGMMEMQMQNYNPASTQPPFDLSTLSAQLTSPSFMATGSHPMTVSMSDMCSIPPYHLESPLSHKSSPCSSDTITLSSDSDTMSHVSHHHAAAAAATATTGFRISDEARRKLFTLAQQKTTALRQITELNSRKNRKISYRTRQNPSDPSFFKLENVQTVETSKHHCPHPGCRKVFRRKEHLKRHQDTIHLRETGIGVEFPCEFCTEKRDKPFNRFDNYKTHVGVHAKQRTSGKVEFVPAAMARYEQLKAETKSRKRGLSEEELAAKFGRPAKPQKQELDSLTDFLGDVPSEMKWDLRSVRSGMIVKDEPL